MIHNFLISKIFRPIAGHNTHSSLVNHMINIGKMYDRAGDKSPSDDRILEEYELRSATYIKDIAQVFGEMKLYGNVIWSTCANPKEYFKAVRSTSIKTKRYQSYTASFAIAFSAGPVEKIATLFFNDEEVAEELYTTRRYCGGDSQMPDPLIEKHLGVGKTPAFRDLCYVVVEDVDLAEFKYKIPKVSAIINKEITSMKDVIQGDYNVNSLNYIKGITLNSKIDLQFLGQALGFDIKSKNGAITFADKGDSDPIKIGNDQVIPIDNAPYIYELYGEGQTNLKLNYLDDKQYKVRSYMSSHSQDMGVKSVNLPFAIDSDQIQTIYQNLNEVKGAQVMVEILANPAVDIGSYVHFTDLELGVMKVASYVYTERNTVVLALSSVHKRTVIPAEAGIQI